MQTWRENVAMSWDGPLEAIVDLPTAILFGVVLSFMHAGTHWTRVLQILEPHWGLPSRTQWMVGGRILHYEAKVPMRVTIRRKSMHVELGVRVKGNRLARIVEAMTKIPGATHLRLKGSVQRHVTLPAAPPELG